MPEHHRNGWLTPEGSFIDAEPTPPTRMRGLELGGHEKAALQYLEQHRLDLLDKAEEERITQGFETWEDTDGHDVVKRFMERHGFKRVAEV